MGIGNFVLNGCETVGPNGYNILKKGVTLDILRGWGEESSNKVFSLA